VLEQGAAGLWAPAAARRRRRRRALARHSHTPLSPTHTHTHTPATTPTHKKKHPPTNQRQLFSEYERPPSSSGDVAFRLPLAQLAEVLGAFAAASSAADDDFLGGGGPGGGPGGGGGGGGAAAPPPLVMTYPGPDGELVLELRRVLDEGFGARLRSPPLLLTL